MSHDIFDLNDCVIDQHTCDQAKRKQRHGVQREPQKVEEPESWNGGQRNGNRRNNRRTPVAQEQEYHNDRKQCALNHGCH